MGGVCHDLMNNKILITGVAAWAISQILKILVHLFVTREFVLERLFGDGGMPSSHSATVTSVAVATGFVCGWDSPVFAVAAIMAIVVMHDAMGVRLETGKQAKAINEIIEHLLSADAVDLSHDKLLKELVGHTPIQVAAGFILGIIVALMMNL
ncbi:MAG: divergent PAP2 family protein [Eubacteriales bacterium]|nr:divergent PAP2 family protein [Eubacteriales bacterium]